MQPTKKITIQDIAESARVSKSTVSRVLNDSALVNESKRKAVLAAIRRLNYQPNAFARSLAGGRSMTIGVVTQNIGSPFYDSVTQGIIARLSGSNYSPIFVDGQWDQKIETAGIRTLLDRNVDGLILVGGFTDVPTFDQLSSTTPTVVVARELVGRAEHCIYLDNVQAGYDATKFLIDAGHRKIAHITGIKDHQDAARRYAGYKQALADANIEFDPDLVVEGNFVSQSGVLGVETLLLRGLSCTAIFAANDEMAFGARLALYRRGIRVPEDVSIFGFDNQPHSAYMTPPLTTIAQPAALMGESAAEMLLGILQGNPTEQTALKAELVIRESVAHIR